MRSTNVRANCCRVPGPFLAQPNPADEVHTRELKDHETPLFSYPDVRPFFGGSFHAASECKLRRWQQRDYLRRQRRHDQP
jgi:hypothetical protein